MRSLRRKIELCLPSLKKRVGIRRRTDLAQSQFDGSVYTKGKGLFGALGHGNTDNHSQFTKIECFEGQQATQVSAGWAHSAVLTGSGEAVVFGRTHDTRNILRIGRLDKYLPWLISGLNKLGASRGIDSLLPSVLELEGETVKHISCSSGVMAVLSASGKVYCYGSNEYGQCGSVEDRASVWTASPVSGLEGHNVVQADMGFQHGVALTDDGSVFTWGKASRGRLGYDPEKEYTNEARRVEALAKERIVAISSGFSTTTALSEDGRLFIWGKMQSSERRGNSAFVKRFKDQLEPREIEFSEKVVDIKGSLFHTALRTESGDLWLVGLTGHRAAQESGDIFPEMHHTPIRVPMGELAGKSISKLLSSFTESCVITDDGQAFTFDFARPPTRIEGTEDFFVHDFDKGWHHSIMLARSR